METAIGLPRLNEPAPDFEVKTSYRIRFVH
jgi:hypothetical protein